MPAYLPTLNWPIYSGWTQFTPTIPKLYWDVYSQEQRIKQLCMDFHKTQCYLDNVAETTNEWSEEFSDALNAELEKMWLMVNSGYQAALQEWFESDLPEIIDNAVKMVFFGLNDDGYFIAYIPESWEEIQFDTGYDYSDQNTYGRLILDMYVTDTFQINEKPTNLIWEVANNG